MVTFVDSKLQTISCRATTTGPPPPTCEHTSNETCECDKCGAIFPDEPDLFDIWVEIFCLGNMHFLCTFLSVFIVTLSQNEPSEGHLTVDKYTKESNGMALFLL